jgi:hypothetical protein
MGACIQYHASIPLLSLHLAQIYPIAILPGDHRAHQYYMSSAQQWES